MWRILIALAALAPHIAPQQPARFAKVQGRVVDLQGKPIAGVAVVDEMAAKDWDRWTTAKMLAEAAVHTDANGRYQIDAGEFHSLMLRFAARGCCTVIRQHWLGAPEDEPLTAVATIALPPGLMVLGRVRDPAGRPIPGARVTTRDLAPSALRLEDAAATDAEGIFQLRGVPSSPLELRVTAEGFAPLLMLPIDRSSPLTVTLEPALSCSGRLLGADGRPMAGQVHLAYEDGAAARAEAGADGAYHFAIRPGVRYRVRTNEPTTYMAVYSDVLEGNAADVELRLPTTGKGNTLELAVTDVATGEAVAGFRAQVDWQATDEHASNVWFFANSLAGREGTLRLPVDPSWQPGRGCVLLRAPGYGEQLLSLPRDGEGGMLRLAASLPSERTVTGNVVDRDGKPVPGATVWTMPRKLTFTTYGGIPGNPVKTDAEGRFRCRGLASTEYVVNVMHPAHPYVFPRAVSVEQGDVDGVTFSLAPAAPVELKWSNAPSAGDWWLVLVPREGRPPHRGDERLPRWFGGSMVRRPIASFDQSLMVPAVAAEVVEVRLTHLTAERLARDVDVGLGTLKPGSGPTQLDLARLQTGRITGRVSTSALAAMEHLLVRSGARYPQGPASLLQADGSFALVVEPGMHRLEVVDLLTGFALGESPELKVASGDQATCDLEVQAGVLDVTIGLPEGATGTAMKYLTVERPTDGLHRDLKQIELNDLRGGLRLVLPPGQVKVGFQRARGMLGVSGNATYVAAGAISVEVVEGRITPLVVKEPPRLSKDELATERGQ